MAYPPAQGQQFYYPPAPVRGTNSLAVVALVCGIGQFFIGVTFIPAIICGHLARRRIRETGEGGDGLALAGLVLGYVGGALFILAVLLIVLLIGRSSGSPAVPVGAGG
jgi:hypothetical protein